jgi:hypothetical protein
MFIIRDLLEGKLIFNILTLSSFYKEYSESIKKRYNKDFDLDSYTFIYKFVDEIENMPNNKFKVLCFSKDYENHLMWAHYAQGHRGVCLIFDSEKLKKDLRDNNAGAEFSCHDIDYKDIDYKDKNISKNWFEVKKEPTKNSLTKKTKHWRYENEHRIIAQNLESNELRYNYSSLTGVIFGAKMSYKNKVDIINALSGIGKNYNNTKFYESSSYLYSYFDNDSGKTKTGAKIKRTEVTDCLLEGDIMKIFMKKESKENNYAALKPFIKSGKLNQKKLNNLANLYNLPQMNIDEILKS